MGIKQDHEKSTRWKLQSGIKGKRKGGEEERKEETGGVMLSTLKMS